ncbi:MAG TPA: hypothetical protein VK165_12095, partial [Azonexus sp.]|nr:hypothetical protein [Azonexus sp.]
KEAITKAKWAGLRLDARALDAPAPEPEPLAPLPRRAPPALVSAPAAEKETPLSRNLAELERTSFEIESDKARGLPSLSSTLERHHQAAGQVVKGLHDLAKSDPGKAWETAGRLEAMRNPPFSVRELKIELGQQIKKDLGLEMARRLGREMADDISRTVGKQIAMGMSF